MRGPIDDVRTYLIKQTMKYPPDQDNLEWDL